MSPKDLADLSGVQQADISCIKRGFLAPAATTLLTLVEGLRARISIELLDESSDQSDLVALR